MEILNSDPLKNVHSTFVVAVHMREPILDHPFVMRYAVEYGMNRRLANRVLETQCVGNVFTLGTRGNPALTCLVIGQESGDAQLSDMNLCVRKMCSLTDAAAALVGQGFKLAHATRNPEEYGFECLRRALLRWEFKGVLYLPPGPLSLIPEGFGAQEPPSKRFISLPNGSVRASLVPAMVGPGPNQTKIKGP